MDIASMGMPAMVWMASVIAFDISAFFSADCGKMVICTNGIIGSPVFKCKHLFYLPEVHLSDCFRQLQELLQIVPLVMSCCMQLQLKSPTTKITESSEPANLLKP